ncbi:MAG: hypothetical protein ACTHLO_02615 [Pseudolabrys sp.]
MLRHPFRGLVGLTALGLLAGAPAQAQNAPTAAVIEFVPSSNHPPAPPGLQLVCMSTSGNGAPNSDTCPVVRYQGISTWAYSFNDNRNSLALVSYNAENKVVRNVEKGGTRYLFDAIASLPTQTVTFIGQGQKSVTVPWSDLGTPAH